MNELDLAENDGMNITICSAVPQNVYKSFFYLYLILRFLSLIELFLKNFIKDKYQKP